VWDGGRCDADDQAAASAGSHGDGHAGADGDAAAHGYGDERGRGDNDGDVRDAYGLDVAGCLLGDGAGG
jgi:hypothetical protein